MKSKIRYLRCLYTLEKKGRSPTNLLTHCLYHTPTETLPYWTQLEAAPKVAGAHRKLIRLALRMIDAITLVYDWNFLEWQNSAGEVGLNTAYQLQRYQVQRAQKPLIERRQICCSPEAIPVCCRGIAVDFKLVGRYGTQIRRGGTEAWASCRRPPFVVSNQLIFEVKLLSFGRVLR